jgi:hypothetical protein
MNEMPPIDGDPFALARSSCFRAVQVAQDVSIDEAALQRFTAQLDVGAVRDVMKGHMGENCDTVPDEFRHVQGAVNFALVFSLLQFGHGFRYELHRLCGRGASQTITLGVRNLHAGGDLGAARLRCLTAAEIRQAFRLPSDRALDELVMQLLTVLHQAGTVLERLGTEDFAIFCRQGLTTPEARQWPAATLVRQLANHFPAFNDQGVLHDGSRVVLVKKATLAIGELRRLVAPHDRFYNMSQDFHRAIAPVDNVIPAMLVYQGVLRLSPALHQVIHQQRTPLARGPEEAELRAAALVACERIVAAAGDEFTALDLGYYLWRSGKAPGVRQFARHHTKDTIFY